MRSGNSEKIVAKGPRNLFPPQLFRKDGNLGTTATLNMSNVPEENGNAPEKKYVIAGIVTFLALLFDYFRMHNGVPFWADGGRL